jgi:hypothetical protein
MLLTIPDGIALCQYVGVFVLCILRDIVELPAKLPVTFLV